jgi:ferric-dicitrate binding protein FerR (iron transport regulator)
VSVVRARNVNHARAARSRAWRDFRTARDMRAERANSAALRAEARVLTTAGLILLAIGFPATLFLALQALQPDGMSPVLPAAIGAPPIVLGYLACHFASQRLVKAKALETGSRR